jgi:hypothetical protein
MTVDGTDTDSRGASDLGQLHRTAALGEQRASRSQDTGAVERGVRAPRTGRWRP